MQHPTRKNYHRLGKAGAILVSAALVLMWAGIASASATTTATVTIDKYIDGQPATALSADSAAFPMTSSWNDPGGVGTGSGPFTLSPTGFNSANPYEAVTAAMDQGASYSTSEQTGGSVVGADCSGGQPFMLAGYTTGSSSAAAQMATPSSSSPSFASLTGNEYVDVWNKDCLASPVNVSPANGATTTSAAFTSASWTGVSDTAGGITYVYQAANSNSTNTDGSFTSPVFTSNALSTTSIATAGTASGTYYWHVQATDMDGNMSPWSAPTSFTVNSSATTTPNSGQIGGTVGANGTLSVDSIQVVKSNATADNSYGDGWEYIFNITVPTNEPDVAMSFSDWLGSVASDTLPVDGNMRIKSAQASNNSFITLTGSNIFSSPPLHITKDLNPSLPGDQIQVEVDVKVPTSTASDSYTTNYAVESNP